MSAAVGRRVETPVVVFSRRCADAPHRGAGRSARDASAILQAVGRFDGSGERIPLAFDADAVLPDGG